jgi:hypothetical protein
MRWLLHHMPVQGMAGHVERAVEVAPQIVEPVQVHWLCLRVAVAVWFEFFGGGDSCAPWQMQNAWFGLRYLH